MLGDKYKIEYLNREIAGLKKDLQETREAWDEEVDGLKAEIMEMRVALATERERNRVREEALVDRLLVRNNARPISPPAQEPPVTVAVKPRSPEDIARYNDFIQEELEVKGGITPDIRRELDEMTKSW